MDKISVSLVHREEEDGAGKTGPAVTSHLYLKPAHSGGTLDKEVVLRRIRHRKRVNSVKNVFRSFFGYPAAGSSGESNPASEKERPADQPLRWADDPFAAP